MQSKTLTSSEKNNSFIEQAKEALLYARLGVDKNKIDEIKAKMAELQALYEAGKISEQDLQAKMDTLQSQLAEEVQKAQQRGELASKKDESELF